MRPNENGDSAWDLLHAVRKLDERFPVTQHSKSTAAVSASRKARPLAGKSYRVTVIKKTDVDLYTNVILDTGGHIKSIRYLTINFVHPDVNQLNSQLEVTMGKLNQNWFIRCLNWFKEKTKKSQS